AGSAEAEERSSIARPPTAGDPERDCGSWPAPFNIAHACDVPSRFGGIRASERRDFGFARNVGMGRLQHLSSNSTADEHKTKTVFVAPRRTRNFCGLCRSVARPWVFLDSPGCYFYCRHGASVRWSFDCPIECD